MHVLLTFKLIICWHGGKQSYFYASSTISYHFWSFCTCHGVSEPVLHQTNFISNRPVSAQFWHITTCLQDCTYEKKSIILRLPMAFIEAKCTLVQCSVMPWAEFGGCGGWGRGWGGRCGGGLWLGWGHDIGIVQKQLQCTAALHKHTVLFWFVLSWSYRWVSARKT